jgi:hypothetical protein
MSLFANLGLKAIQTGAKVMSKAEKNSPEILIGAGIVLGVAAGVTACMATAKAEETLDEIKEDIEEAKEAPEEEKSKEVSKAYVMAAGKMVKLYWKPMALGAMSIASILCGHNILRKRHIALAAAYGSLEKAYDGLRKRIEEEFSKEAAERFANGIKVVEDPRKDKDGKKKKGTIDIIDPDKVLSPYTYIFGPDCATWTGNMEYDIMFLQGCQKFANDTLITSGKLVLSDMFVEMRVYEWLDKNAYVTGWVLPPHYYKETCAPYVNFNISRVFKDYQDGNGPIEVLMVNFNCDGYIWDKLA